MATTRVRGELGPACAKCQGVKAWCGTRWLCRPCQARANRDRRASLTDIQRASEARRANDLRNVRRSTWSPQRREREYERIRAWRLANREAYLQGARDWYWRDPEGARTAKLAEYRRNPKKFLARNLVRKARVLGQVCEHGPKCVSAEFLKALYADACLYCGAPAEEADHFMPLARGGLHCVENLVPACAPCNGSKAHRDPGEWIESLAS